VGITRVTAQTRANYRVDERQIDPLRLGECKRRDRRDSGLKAKMAMDYRACQYSTSSNWNYTSKGSNES